MLRPPKAASSAVLPQASCLTATQRLFLIGAALGARTIAADLSGAVPAASRRGAVDHVVDRGCRPAALLQMLIEDLLECGRIQQLEVEGGGVRRMVSLVHLHTETSKRTGGLAGAIQQRGKQRTSSGHAAL